MTLAELQYVVAVVQEQHFGRAAERVFVTQPALSLAIKKLEDDLGVTIFERRQKRVELTPLGEQIVHQAQRVLEEVERVKMHTAQGKDQLNRLLRFGVIATVGPLYSSRSSATVQRTRPEDALGAGGEPDTKFGGHAEERKARCDHGRTTLRGTGYSHDRPLR